MSLADAGAFQQLLLMQYKNNKTQVPCEYDSEIEV